MTDYETFGIGGIRFPLTASLTNSLLEDADPALFHLSGFLAAVIKKYAGPRLLAQAAAELPPLNFPSAVETTITIEPQPVLLNDHFKFPLLAVYRKSARVVERTATGWETWECVIGFAWCLPPLTPLQETHLDPILNSVAKTIGQRIRHGQDSAYLSGANAWAAAGIERIQLDTVSWGAWGAFDANAKLFRSVMGEIRLWERDSYVEADFEAMDGVTVHEDFTAPDGSQIVDYAIVGTYAAPTLASLDVATGSKAGGTAVTLTGTNYVVGTTPRVFFGTEEASDVVVTSATTITSTTPPHDAYPTEIVDVYVVNADGQASDALTNAFTFTTP